MTIGLLVGMLFAGFVLGLAFAIWLITMAGYEWATIMHAWYLALVYRRHKAEIDEQLEELIENRGLVE